MRKPKLSIQKQLEMKLIQLSNAHDLLQDIQRKANSMPNPNMTQHISNMFVCTDEEMRYDQTLGWYLLYQHKVVPSMQIVILSNGLVICETKTYRKELLHIN
jgi:hypothetical protein